MAIVFAADIFTTPVASAASASATFVNAPSNDVVAGRLAVISVAVDNGTGGNADTTEITLSDSVGGNTWTRAHERSGSATAAAWAQVAIFYSVIVNTITTAGTITVTFAAPTRTAKVVGGKQYTIGSGSTFSVLGGSAVVGSTAPTSVTTGVALTIGDPYLFVIAHAIESSTSGGSWTTIDGSSTDLLSEANETSGGGGASNMGLRASYRPGVASATSVSGAGSGFPAADHVRAILAIKETLAPSGNPRPIRVIRQAVNRGAVR